MKRTISILLCVCLTCMIIPTTFAARSNTVFEERLAYTLKSLGLFKGVSDTEFELNRAPSRAEAIVMLIRVLGKENEALYANWQHPFTDVPAWADKYVGYAYSNGLTNGASATTFGTGNADAAMYLTFVLRALGYSDSNGDFAWHNPYGLAANVGILPNGVDLNNFLRADVVLISYSALQANIKNSQQTLAEKLILAGVFSKAVFDSCYDEDIIENHSAGSTELSAEEISALCSSAVFYIEVYDEYGDALGSGSGFFIDSNGTAVTNYHVIDGAHSALILTTGTEEVYEVAGVYDYNETYDWAVIKIDGSDFPYLNIGDTSALVSGAPVYAIGSPLGLDNSFSQGIVSNPRRVLNGVSYIQITAPISHGSSGGALLNKYGEVIGITSAGFTDGQNLNLALPISVINNYSRSGLLSLSDVSYEWKPYDDSYQATAFELLYAWLEQNYNDVSSSGDIEYVENYETNDYDASFVVSYDSNFDAMTFSTMYFYPDTSIGWIIYLTSSGYSFPIQYLSIDAETSDINFSCIGELYGPSLTPEYKFEYTETKGKLYSWDKELALDMCYDTISTIDVILNQELSYYGDYSVADFGFINMYE